MVMWHQEWVFCTKLWGIWGNLLGELNIKVYEVFNKNYSTTTYAIKQIDSVLKINWKKLMTFP